MKLMKSLFIVGVVAAMVGNANADLKIDWFNPGGYWDNTDTTGAGNVAGGIYGILILDADGVAGLPYDNDLAGGGTVISSAELTGLAGNAYGYGVTVAVGPDPFTGGFVYARVFQAADALGAATPGTWYYDGPVIAVVNIPANVPPLPAQQYFANVNGSASPYGGDPLNTGQVQVIPEPASLALLGLGALTVFLRRRRS